jgi:hypothetical protein
MNNDQIIQKIKTENLKPISKYIFLLRRTSIWFLLALSTIFGAYAFAFFFLKTLYIDFENWNYTANSYNTFLMENIPIIWILLFIVSLILMFYLFKRTNRGYKYSIIFIGSVSLGVSFLLGIILSKTFYGNILIERFENERAMDWTNPKSGRLSGEVLFIDNDYILIRDIQDDVWNVDTSYLLDNSVNVLENYQMISIIGRYDYENNFIACQIMPFVMNKERFRPNPLFKNINRINRDNDMVNGICKFVINNR